MMNKLKKCDSFMQQKFTKKHENRPFPYGRIGNKINKSTGQNHLMTKLP